MPPMKQHASARASRSASTTTKLPSVRCTPSIFLKVTDHLNMRQRMKINELGFGGLLEFYAEELASSDLLVYLMSQLNPPSMILEVGNEGGLKINELSVRKVLGLPQGDRDPPSSTEEENARALIEFRNSVRAEQNKKLKCNDLLYILRKFNIENALAVRIFFVVAFNKLLFPALDNSIRGQDAFSTKGLSEFRNINWCKAILHGLCHAAITWRSEKKNSIPGCGIFLIIFYLDNLESRSSIAHFRTPRAKYFHKGIMENLISEDKWRDRFGNVAFGNLQLKNIAKTCYQFTVPEPNGVSTAANYSSIPMFPCAEQLGVQINDLSSSSSRNKATDSLQQLAAKGSKAINLIQTGSKMLVDAHKEFIHTMRTIVEKEHVEKTRDHDHKEKAPPNDNQIRSNEHCGERTCCQSD